MAEELRVWRIDDAQDAVLLERLSQVDRENELEGILLRNSDLLGPDIAVVGRQMRTDSGPLDLLGVTSDGQLVVYELKRARAPREAITQALDYASRLDEMTTSQLAEHIEKSSGENGIPRIDHFADWYADHSSIGDLSRRGRTAICCVGIGVDAATLRMAKWLREAGVDISIIEFTAYQHGDAKLLARNVELDDDDDQARPEVAGHGFGPHDRARERNALPQFECATEIMRNCFRKIQDSEQQLKNLLRFRLPDMTGYGGQTRQINAANVCVVTQGNASGQVYIVIYDHIAKKFPQEFKQMQTTFESAGVRQMVVPKKDWHAFRASLVEEIKAVQPALEEFLATVVAHYGNDRI